MRNYSNDEKKIIAETVQDSFLFIVGKRWHTCRWETLAMLDILRWLDPQGAYVDCWALTWMVANRRGPLPESESDYLMWDFEERYRLGLKQQSRIKFWNEHLHRMAHSYVLANPGHEAEIIDISSNYHGDLLRHEMELPIRWRWDFPYVWQTFGSLPEGLRDWYRPAESVRDTEYQDPPPGLIPKVVEEARGRLTALGMYPL
jgi:hypothetical protein